MDDVTTLIMDPAELTLTRHMAVPVKPCLLLYSGPDAGRRFDLEPGPQYIGRAIDAQVRVEAAGVSRQHAQLLIGTGLALISDMGSANGTWVNDQRVAVPTALKDGDLVRLSNVVLRFHASNNLDLLLHDRIYRQATVDTGTGAFNRRFLQDALRQACARARRQSQPVSVVTYDLDHFKAVNDRYGHPGGDMVLRVVTTVARAELRDCDVLARMGGEEFVVLLEGAGLAGAVEVAERIRAAVEEFEIELPDPDDARRSVRHRQTVSLGVAALGLEADGEAAVAPDDATLLLAADRALYAAKRRGRNQVAA